MRRTARRWPVAFTVEGLNIERFVRYAGEQKIQLSGIRRMAPRRLTGCVRESMLPALEDIALRGGWKLTKGRRKGTGRAADWLHNRWLLAAAMVIGGIALLAVSQVMWQVDILDAGTYEADIRHALHEMGIEAPMLRSQVDIGELRDALEWRYPRIAWFECGWRGTALVIRPVEGVMPRIEGTVDGFGDVVATRDAVVHSVVTRAGTPVVKAGDVVRAGDVLIKGEERTSEGAVKTVAAQGNVTGRVWLGASVTLPAVEIITTYTGNTEIVWTVRTPWFDLWQMGESAYEQYDTAVSEQPICGIYLPMVLHVETRMEAECAAQMRDLDEVKAEAREASLRKLHEKIGAEESLIDIWGNCSMIDAEKVQSVAIGEMLVEIGIQRSSTGMAAPGE